MPCIIGVQELRAVRPVLGVDEIMSMIFEQESSKADQKAQTSICSDVPINPKIAEEEEEKKYWGSKAEFVLSCIGFSVRNIKDWGS